MTPSPCPICDAQPVVISPTMHGAVVLGNTAIRCDGQPAGGEPRHTIYVFDRDPAVAADLWEMVAARSGRS